MKHRLRVIIIAALLVILHIAAARYALVQVQTEEQQHMVLWALAMCMALFAALAGGKNWARMLTVILCGVTSVAGFAAALLSVSGKIAFFDAVAQRQLMVTCVVQLSVVIYLCYSRGLKSDLRKLRH